MMPKVNDIIPMLYLKINWGPESPEFHRHFGVHSLCMDQVLKVLCAMDMVLNMKDTVPRKEQTF